MVIITRLYWDRLFTKKEFILSLSCFLMTVIVSVLDIRQFIEVKTSTNVSPISSDSIFWWLPLLCLKVITLLELSCLGFLLYLCCSIPWLVLDSWMFFFCICICYIHSDNMFGTLMLFSYLLGPLSPACFSLLTDIQFSFNHCLNLFNKIWFI